MIIDALLFKSKIIFNKRLLIGLYKLILISLLTDMMVRNELHLPQNFADKLIELESLLEDQRSMDLITELNELYRVHSSSCRLA